MHTHTHTHALTRSVLSARACRILSVGLVVASAGYKLPQIGILYRANSAVGAQILPAYIEVLTFLLAVMYNFSAGNAFLVYGETVFISVQNLVIVLLMWRLGAGVNPIHRVGFLCIVCLLVATPWILGQENSQRGLSLLMLYVSLPLAVGGRLMLAMSNASLGHTGLQSGATSLMALAGSAARIFTTINEVGMDIPQLAGFAASLVLNGVLFAQILFYRAATAKAIASSETAAVGGGQGQMATRKTKLA
jgi:mannose-P-dolichol utilization defect protein 1